jgi:UDP-glucose 4-epimerase
MEEFRNATVLITGGVGFIGSNLAIRLAELGANVTVVDSLIPEYGGNLKNIEPVADRITVNIADVRDEHAMKYLIQNKDFLFNLAGQTSHLDSMENPYPDLEINARAQLSILEACKKFNPRIRSVYASTRQVYGVPQSLPVDERHPLVPVDVNGINKLAGEQYHLLYNNVYNIRSAVLRLTNTYGPRMRVKDARQTFLGIWIRRLLENDPVLVYGDGKQVRDFNYVDDVVDALLLAAVDEKAYGQIFNLGADDPTNLKDVAQKLTSIHAGEYEIVAFPNKLKAIDIGDYYGDYRRIRSHLGWTPKISLEEGLARTAEYYKTNLEFYL